MKEITLSCSRKTQVDDEDYDTLSKIKWWSKHDPAGLIYACSTVFGMKIRMHRVILGAKEGEIVDHKDGNGLNNTKENLRITNQSLNCFKRRIRSRYRGIEPRNNGRFTVRIRLGGNRHHLGTFDTRKGAYEAYKKAAIDFYGREVCIEAGILGEEEDA
jgi:hypothetical protein